MARTTSIRLQGNLQPEQTLTYVHVPFDVPSGVRQIDVQYTYSDAIGSDPHLTGGNTVDIGIFDIRGIDFMTEGFRGWSGSARSHFFLGIEAATPGYMPGSIQPGTWHVCLGAYKIAPIGCDYTIEITFTLDAILGRDISFPSLLPLRENVGHAHLDHWYRGELHCHSLHSDGDSTPEEIVRLAEARGLDFLALTDHNNRSHLADLADIATPLMLIPGFEVTTYHGHWNVWGDDPQNSGGGWIDFRIQNEGDMTRAMAQANARGYLVSCNHPRPYGPEWAFPSVSGYVCVEVWNGPWAFFNAAALEFWETRLARGERLVAVGGSDHHFSHREHPAQLGSPTTFIYCPEPPSPARLLQHLRAGHAFITDSPNGAQIRMRAGETMMGDAMPRPVDNQLVLTLSLIGGAGGRLQIIGASGVLWEQIIESSDAHLEAIITLDATPYVRAQWIDTGSGLMRALTNPIYIA